MASTMADVADITKKFEEMSYRDEVLSLEHLTPDAAEQGKQRMSDRSIACVENSHGKASEDLKDSSTEPTTTVVNGKTLGLVEKGFRFAPPEVREMIFTAAFSEDHFIYAKREIPTLIKALLGDKELVDEATNVFWKTTTFIIMLTSSSMKFFGVKPEKVQRLKLIGWLVESVLHSEIDANNNSSRSSYSLMSNATREFLSRSSNVKNLCLSFTRDEKDAPNSKDVFKTTVVCLHHNYANLTRFTIIIGMRQFIKKTVQTAASGDLNQKAGYEQKEMCLTNYPELKVIKSISKGFGFEGDIVMFNQDALLCVWRAKRKGVLEWKEDNIWVAK